MSAWLYRRLARAAIAAAPACGVVAPLEAQHPTFAAGTSATLVYDRVDPVPGGGSADELRVIHPVAMLHGTAAGGRLGFTGMLNLEGLTLADGQLAPGVAGEGFADRRHPHTWLHEAVVTLQHDLPAGRSGGSVSLSAGKGFAPFGTDDPMSRPVVRYPVNHHHAQILERFVAIAAARVGPAVIEGALFNGDEPDGPDQWPNIGRFGDSWSARLTLIPLAGLELQGSLAHIASPEHRDGGGLDHAKWSLSARFGRAAGEHRLYGLAELARNDEGDGAFIFHSALAEGAWNYRRHAVHYRIERTERAEEQRLPDLWRTPRPHHDFSNLGATRWTIHTIGYAFDAPAPRSLALAPLVEVSVGRVRSLTPGSFDPVLFYGRETFWSLTAGVRIGWGTRLHRMGRYGAADLTPGPMRDAGVEHIH